MYQSRSSGKLKPFQVSWFWTWTSLCNNTPNDNDMYNFMLIKPYLSTVNSLHALSRSSLLYHHTHLNTESDTIQNRHAKSSCVAILHITFSVDSAMRVFAFRLKLEPGWTTEQWIGCSHNRPTWVNSMKIIVYLFQLNTASSVVENLWTALWRRMHRHSWDVCMTYSLHVTFVFVWQDIPRCLIPAEHGMYYLG